MDIYELIESGGRAYVVGTSFCFPPRYVRFDKTSGWTWTGDLAKAKAFATNEQAESNLKDDMSALVGGDVNVKVLKVEMKVSEAQD